jgi:hypothetical protein
MMPATNLEPPLVCERLRAKGAGVVYGTRVTFDAGFAPTATFWCLETADPVGPDDGFVHPHVCLETRGCYCAVSSAVSRTRPESGS